MAMVQCLEYSKDISDKAPTCPHCGYPVKPAEQPPKIVYKLQLGTAYGSDFATFLKVLAVIVWIVGLILAVVGAQVLSRFSWQTFFTVLFTYLINGIIFWGLANVVEDVRSTIELLLGLRLDKEEGKSVPASYADNTKPSYFNKPKLFSEEWTCLSCGTRNSSENNFCKNCGVHRV